MGFFLSTGTVAVSSSGAIPIVGSHFFASATFSSFLVAEIAMLAVFSSTLFATHQVQYWSQAYSLVAVPFTHLLLMPIYQGLPQIPPQHMVLKSPH